MTLSLATPITVLLPALLGKMYPRSGYAPYAHSVRMCSWKNKEYEKIQNETYGIILIGFIVIYNKATAKITVACFSVKFYYAFAPKSDISASIIILKNAMIPSKKLIDTVKSGAYLRTVGRPLFASYFST